MALAYYDVNLVDTREKTTEVYNFHNTRDKTVVALIPAYNEARSIKNVVRHMHRYADMVLVVDDGSSDGTADMAQAARAIVIKHSQNQGKGAALRTGFQEALKFKPDIVVTIDADGQHLPHETTHLIAPILRGQAELVVGSRYLQNTSNVPQHRIWGHHVFNFILNTISGVPVTDSQSGFRAFSARALRAISFQSNGFTVESEMQFLARKFKLRVAEVPITVRYEGEVKRSVMMQGLMVLAGILKLTAYHRPMLCYSSLSILFVLFGLLWGMWLPDFYQTLHPTELDHLTASLPFSMIGLLVLLTGLIVHTGQRLFNTYAKFSLGNSLPNIRQLDAATCFWEAFIHMEPTEPKV